MTRWRTVILLFLGLLLGQSAWAMHNPDLDSAESLGLQMPSHQAPAPSGSVVNLQVWLNPDPIGLLGGRNLYGFCGNDPINFTDWLGLIWGDKSKNFFVAWLGRSLDPRSLVENIQETPNKIAGLSKAVKNEWIIDADAAWNSGFGLGDGMRVAGDFYTQKGTQSSSTSLNFVNNFTGSLMNMGGGIVTPQSYVDGCKSLQNRAENVMVGEYLNGSGGTWTTLQGLSSIVGDATGYNGVMAGSFGVDRQNSTLLSTSDRWSQGIMGGSQLILTAVGLKGTYDPNAGFIRPFAPENVNPVANAKPQCNPAAKTGLNAENLKLSQTLVNKHLNAVTKEGELARPYYSSQGQTLITREIMAAKPPIPDPGGFPGALRWDVPGQFRGSSGTWELVVDPKTDTIFHWNFVTPK